MLKTDQSQDAGAEPGIIRQVDPTSSVPRSVQAMRNLLAAISSGAIGPMLPNQHDLAGQMGTSLATIRQAIEMLKAEGRLATVPSVGTFVREEKTEHDRRPVALLQVTDMAALADSGTRSRLVGAEEVEAPGRAGDLADQECWHWEWRLLGDELEPCAVVNAWAERSFARGAERAGSPLDLLLASRDALRRMEVTARAAIATPTERRGLLLDTSESVMFVTSVGYGPDGARVLYMEWVMSANMALSTILSWPPPTWGHEGAEARQPE